MQDTTISLSPALRSRLMQGYDGRQRRTPAVGSGTPSRAPAASTPPRRICSPISKLNSIPNGRHCLPPWCESQRLRAVIAGNVSVALAWNYDPGTGVYWHDGGTGGFTSHACFNPRRDFAAVVLMNAAPLTIPFVPLLGEHVQQRLSGEPALSLTPVSAPAAGPIRSFFAYWITMLAAGAFIFCCVLGLQGFAAQILPRRWFLRASSFLQLAVFCLLVSAYFLQRSPVTVLVAGPRKPWVSWIPSYWFVGMYQQLSGSLHPALAPFALARLDRLDRRCLRH